MPGTTNGTTTPKTRRKVTVDCSKGGRTHQSFKDECDINKIMARHKKTGLIRRKHMRPQYGDFANVGDYQEALNIAKTAEAMFGELDSRVRARFNNDPGAFLEFCDDPNNQAEAIDLGIAAPPEPEPEVVTEPVAGENPITGGE